MTWVHNASPELDAQSQWPLIVGICICLTALMTVTVILRLYVRGWMIKSLGVDDYVILFSMVCSIVYNGLCIAQSRYSEINFAGRSFYMAGIAGFKVALCFAYLRITGSNIQSTYRRIVWSFMGFTILTHIGGTLVLLLQCKPVYKSWRPQTPGSCLPNDITFYVLAAISIFCDVVIFLMPVPLLLQVRINIRRKIGLIAIFMLGTFTTVCSIMRMYQIITIAQNGNSTMLVLWGTIEMNIGIFLTCLPSLTPLFTFFANKSKTSGLYYRRTKNTHTTNTSLQLQKVANTSQSSGTVTPQRSESEERIIHGQGRRSLLITKTTDIEVQHYDSNNEAMRHKG